MRSEQWRYTVLVKFKKTQVLPADTQSKDSYKHVLKRVQYLYLISFRTELRFFFWDFFFTQNTTARARELRGSIPN